MKMLVLVWESVTKKQSSIAFQKTTDQIISKGELLIDDDDSFEALTEEIKMFERSKTRSSTRLYLRQFIKPLRHRK